VKPDQIVKLPSLQAAPLLLGCTLARKLPGGMVKFKIVETEAYHQADPASHSYAGLTGRTAPMFKAGGHIYVYFTYGMHYCLNIVTGPSGVGEAVLLRAAEPLAGIDLMQQNRGITNINNLANGPAKLAQALGIRDTKLSGTKLSRANIWLEPVPQAKGSEIVTTTRIGIKKAVDQPWRFYIKDNPFVSGYTKAKHGS
jgi:DNA-3-methyladenine glycosylase